MVLNRRPNRMSPAEIQTLLEKGVNDHVAFLPATASARTLAETLAALANANGGTVVVGVKKNGALHPSVEPAAMREKIVEAGLLADPPLILPAPQAVAYPHDDDPNSGNPPDTEATIVVVQVPSGLPHLYSVRGRYLTRTARQNRALTTPELRRLLLERGDSGFEETAVEDASLADLDPRKVERYLERIDAAPDEDSLQLLLSRGCVIATGDGAAEDAFTPTVAGILLFGRDPQRFLRSAEIICVRYMDETMSDEFVRQDVYGTLPEQVRQVEAFVTSNMRRGMRIAGVSREEVAEYPLAVVREAIVNAIAHRDYSIRGEGIRVLMFNDRMEVYSPGRLPGHVTLDNLVDERYSRNEAIVAVLTDLGYIERLGYGIDRMFATMQQSGLPEPRFEETAAGFRVILYSAGADLVSGQPAQQPGPHLYLNERQEKAMAHVQANGRIANSDYQELVPEVSAETIRRDLADLVDKGLLIRIGNKRATYYILK